MEALIGSPRPRLPEGASPLCHPSGKAGASVCGRTLRFDPTSDSGFIIFPSTVIMPLIMPGNEKPQTLSAQRPWRSLLYYECGSGSYQGGKWKAVSTATLMSGGLARAPGQLRLLWVRDHSGPSCTGCCSRGASFIPDRGAQTRKQGDPPPTSPTTSHLACLVTNPLQAVFPSAQAFSHSPVCPQHLVSR